MWRHHLDRGHAGDRNRRAEELPIPIIEIGHEYADVVHIAMGKAGLGDVEIGIAPGSSGGASRIRFEQLPIRQHHLKPADHKLPDDGIHRVIQDQAVSESKWFTAEGELNHVEIQPKVSLSNAKNIVAVSKIGGAEAIIPVAQESAEPRRRRDKPDWSDH